MAGSKQHHTQQAFTKTHDNEAIQRFYDFFISSNSLPANPALNAKEVARLLNSPLLTQQIFANTVLAIIDQSQMKYLYMGHAAKDFTGHEASVLMEKGLSFLVGFIVPEDLNFMLTVYPKVYEAYGSLPVEKRLYGHFHYNFRLNMPAGIAHLHQQTIPLALNDRGEPYLVLAALSNITDFKKDNTIHYRFLLKLPSSPSEVLFSGNSREGESVLTNRERVVVQHLAEGKDSQDIADQLFISPATVRTHRKNILQKTGAKNVANLVQLALANGWI